MHNEKLKVTYEPLAKFALNPHPIHHPKEMDLTAIHLKDEDAALELVKKRGVTPLHLPSIHELEISNDLVFEPGQSVLFQGFEVYEANMTDQATLANDEAMKTGTKDDTLPRASSPWLLQIDSWFEQMRDRCLKDCVVVPSYNCPVKRLPNTLTS